MKRLANNFFTAAAMMMAAAVAFSACEPQAETVDPKVEVSQNEITSESAGDTYDITVTSNVAWNAQIANQDTWVVVKPASGEAGETPVTVTVKKNNSDQPRETSISFVGETSTATVAVKQFAKDVITIDKKAFEVTPAGGSDAVKVTANTEWTATVSEGADWVTVAPATGAAGETTATVTVAANATAQAREAKVTFTAGDAKAEYTISQEAVSVTLSSNSISDAGEGKTATVNVTANAAWTAASSADWVTVAPASGNAGVTEVTVTVAENPSEEARNAKVTFTINENVSAELSVTQAFVKQAGKIDIKVGAVTASKADLTFTPDPATGFTYYWDVLPKEIADLMFPTDDDIMTYIVGSVSEQLAAYSMTWADVIDEGVVEYTYTGLEPLTDFYVVAFGLDTNGEVTTKLFKTEFKTADVNPALKSWMGTWEVTSEKTAYSEKGGRDGIYDEPTTRIINIGTKSAGFGIAVEESELIVSGLSYTDGLEFFGPGVKLETVGTVTSKGNLEMKNEFVSFDATSAGMGEFTFMGLCWSDALAREVVVSGNYPPYTLVLGTDKTTGTGTPYSGELSNGADFTVVYYDMFSVDAASGGISSYYSDPVYGGALAGNWTLKKVEEVPAAAPQSMKIETRLAKEMKIKENNLMKNLNSSYLFQSVQAR